MFTVLMMIHMFLSMMIHMFLSMMIGADVATGNYTRMAIEIVGQAIIWAVMEALFHD